MQRQRWICANCGMSYTTETVILPVYCSCGTVDREGKTITAESGEPLRTPPIRRMTRLALAAAKWIEAGRPERSDNEVDDILRIHCSRCPHFVYDHCSHPKCGCYIRSSKDDKQTILGWLISPALANKLRMATEHCPIGKW